MKVKKDYECPDCKSRLNKIIVYSNLKDKAQSKIVTDFWFCMKCKKVFEMKFEKCKE